MIQTAILSPTPSLTPLTTTTGQAGGVSSGPMSGFAASLAQVSDGITPATVVKPTAVVTPVPIVAAVVAPAADAIPRQDGAAAGNGLPIAIVAAAPTFIRQSALAMPSIDQAADVATKADDAAVLAIATPPTPPTVTRPIAAVARPAPDTRPPRSAADPTSDVETDSGTGTEPGEPDRTEDALDGPFEDVGSALVADMMPLPNLTQLFAPPLLISPQTLARSGRRDATVSAEPAITGAAPSTNGIASNADAPAIAQPLPVGRSARAVPSREDAAVATVMPDLPVPDLPVPDHAPLVDAPVTRAIPQSAHQTARVASFIDALRPAASGSVRRTVETATLPVPEPMPVDSSPKARPSAAGSPPPVAPLLANAFSAIDTGARTKTSPDRIRTGLETALATQSDRATLGPIAGPIFNAVSSAVASAVTPAANRPNYKLILAGGLRNPDTGLADSTPQRVGLVQSPRAVQTSAEATIANGTVSPSLAMPTTAAPISPLRDTVAIAPAGVPFALSTNAAVTPAIIVAGTLATAQPVLQPTAKSGSTEATPRWTATEATTPVALAMAQPVMAQPQPGMVASAAHVFGAAIQAATKPRDDRETPTGTLDLPAMPAAAAPVEQISTASAQQAPLDMRQERWPHAMIERIDMLRDAANATDTRIRLIPDALGAIDVSVRTDGDTVHVQFNADQAATRTLLADAQPRLAELAEARGLKLGQGAVGNGDAGGNAGGNAGTSQQRAPAMPHIPNRTARVSAPAADAADDTRIA